MRSTISITRLRAALNGRVIAPGDAGYDQARAVFYGGFGERRPAVIIQAADASDVARVVELARETGLELPVRGGGHSNAGHGVSHGGIVLDLGGMRALDIDVAARTAWAQTGLTAGEYTAKAHEHGLATGFGDTASVGIGGLTLGGGVGYLVRKHGLTIDDLLAAEIVTADGQLLRADAETHPDLFWAIRGGGGNFGVATRFHFRLHQVGTIVGGILMLPATAEVIASFIAEAEAAPEELSTILHVVPAPPMPFVPAEHRGQLAVIAMLAYAGAIQDGERAVAPFRALATPIADMVRPMAYPDVYPPEEADFHPTAAARTMFVDTVDRRAAETILDHLRASDAPMRAVQLRVLGGAMARVPRRGQRLRAPRATDHGQHRRVLPGARGPGRARGMGRRLRRGASSGRARGLRRFPRRRGPGPSPRSLPWAQLGPPRRDQASLRPSQPVPAQPEHPAGQPQPSVSAHRRIVSARGWKLSGHCEVGGVHANSTATDRTARDRPHRLAAGRRLLRGLRLGPGDRDHARPGPAPSLPRPATRCGLPDAQAKSLWFAARDGVQIDGVMVGSGPSGVVLAHQSQNDLCDFWPYAVFVSRHGLRVLDIDLRCNGLATCPDGEAAEHLGDDVAGAVAELRRQGATSVALVGASMGGTASLVAGATTQPPVGAVVSLSGPANFQGMDAASAVAQLARPVLFVIARGDASVTVDEVQSLYRATRATDKQLVVLEQARYDGVHGWDLLTDANREWSPIAEQVADFLERHAGA
jgi:FAD/FMN-containing dehydrogenase/pimeloyl-ACP methyl ester carboxylesterase